MIVISDYPILQSTPYTLVPDQRYDYVTGY